MADVVRCQGKKVMTYSDLEKAMAEALAPGRTSPYIVQVVVESKSIPKNAEWKEALDAKH